MYGLRTTIDTKFSLWWYDTRISLYKVRVVEQMTPILQESGMTTWTCPECGYENELFMLEGDSLPEELECPICNFNSGPIEWTEVQHDDEGAYYDIEITRQ